MNCRYSNVIFALGIAVLGLIPVPSSHAGPIEASVGRQLTDVEMIGLNGPNRYLSDYQGLPLIINVWASWCTPCRQEMGSLNRLAKRYGGRRFSVIGISTDDHRDRAEAILKATNPAFKHFIDNRLILEKMLGADRIPLTVLVDANGYVVAKYFGAREWDSPESLRLIAEALKVKIATQ